MSEIADFGTVILLVSASLGLALLPLRVQTEEDLVAEDAADGRENRFPGAERELHDRLKVFLLERTDLDRVFGQVTTVTGQLPISGGVMLLRWSNVLLGMKPRRKRSTCPSQAYLLGLTSTTRNLFDSVI